MALPFFDSSTKRKKDQILAVDLGNRTTKAIQLNRRGESFALTRYALLDAPIVEKTMSSGVLSEHLRAVIQALDSKVRHVSLVTSVNDAVVRHAEMPRIPVDDMRMILKHNSRGYLQQDLPSHVFDCHLLQPNDAEAGASRHTSTNMGKQRVIVAGGKQELVDSFVEGAREAGLQAECIFPGLVGSANSFELAESDTFRNDVVALVDIGFKSSSICILQRGELVLSRVVSLGGDRMTDAVSQFMGISYAEAEGIKVGMPAEVQSALESVILPLGHELRASIDFFEHQHDQPVTAVYLTGGSTRSEFIVQVLQQELMIETRTWNPTGAIQLDLPPQQAAEVEQIAPQLAVAIGGGIAAL